MALPATRYQPHGWPSTLGGSPDWFMWIAFLLGYYIFAAILIPFFMVTSSFAATKGIPVQTPLTQIRGQQLEEWSPAKQLLDRDGVVLYRPNIDAVGVIFRGVDGKTQWSERGIRMADPTDRAPWNGLRAPASHGHVVIVVLMERGTVHKDFVEVLESMAVHPPAPTITGWVLVTSCNAVAPAGVPAKTFP